MGDLPHKQLPKLRTFQLDQAHARGEAPLPTPTKDTEQKKTPAPVAQKIIITTSSKDSNQDKKEVPQPVKPQVSLTPPAFHELKKSAANKIEHIVAEAAPAPQKTVTVRKMSAPQPSRSFSSEATVITSAKKNDFKLFPSLITSFKTWLGGFSNTSDTPKYTVSTIERRKGLIQKATTKSGATFTTDTTSIKEGITKKREEITPEAPHDIHLNWSPNTEPGFSLLEEPHRPIALPAKKTVVVEYKKKTTPASELPEQNLRQAPVPKRVFVPPPPPKESHWESDASSAPDSPYAPAAYTAPAQPPVVRVIETPPVAPPPVPPIPPPQPPVFRVPENIQKVPIPVPTVSPVPIQTPTAPVLAAPAIRITKPGTSIPNKPNPKTSYLRRGLRELFRFDTTVATVVLVGSIVSFVMVFLIVRTLVGIISPSTNSSETVLSAATPLTSTAKVIDLAISAKSLDALMSALQNQARPGTGVVEFRIIEASGTPLSKGDLWQTFGFSGNPNLSRSVSQAHVGYSDGEHILVLKVTDAVTVFGALLAWEKDMPGEFSVLFNQEFDSVTSVEDSTVGSSDIRILKHENETMLVYGFIDKNTVLITESLETYQATLGTE